MYANKNKSVNNIYNELNDEDVDVNQNSNTNFHRKAEKKLREIEKLESKPGIYLTDEEIKKINLLINGYLVSITFSIDMIINKFFVKSQNINLQPQKI